MLLLFKGQIGLWWNPQNSENQQIIHRELIPRGKDSMVIEFQRERGSWDSTQPLFYRYRKSGLALNVHLFDRCSSGCIMCGTSFRAYSKSDEKTERS